MAIAQSIFYNIDIQEFYLYRSVDKYLVADITDTVTVKKISAHDAIYAFFCATFASVFHIVLAG